MANRVTMGICGQDYTLVADENASYMEKVGARVDKKMRELMDTAHVSRSDAAVLAAINLADELLKNQEAGENLRRAKLNGGEAVNLDFCLVLNFGGFLLGFCLGGCLLLCLQILKELLFVNTGEEDKPFSQSLAAFQGAKGGNGSVLLGFGAQERENLLCRLRNKGC